MLPSCHLHGSFIYISISACLCPFLALFLSLSICISPSPPFCFSLLISLPLTNFTFVSHFLLTLLQFLSLLHLTLPSLYQLMSIARSILGKRGFALLLRPFVYAQFVAGETEGEISQSMEKMSALGLRPMLAVPIEEDLGEGTG